MVTVENHGYGFVHGIQLVQEVDCCLIGDAHALCIGIDLSTFVIIQVFGDVRVVPEFLRTLVFARPRGDDQFADCTFSPSLDMSR